MFNQLDHLNLTDFFYDKSILQEDLKKVDLSFFHSGKKIRGSLVMMFGQILKYDLDRLITHARVAEMVHNSTLVHDDVIDLSSTRRGHFTINEVLGNKKAVLTGDYLLSRSMYELAQEGNLLVVQDMSQTLKDLVEGEWIQMSPPSLDQLQLDFLIEVSKRKTSSLLRWCCLAPLRQIEASDEIINLAGKFADHLGIGYQMTDDVLDFSKDSNKTFSLDLVNGLPNYVIFEAFKINSQVADALGNVTGLDQLSPDVRDAINQACPKVASLAQNNIDLAINYLNQMINHLNRTQQVDVDAVEQLKSFLTLIKNRTV